METKENTPIQKFDTTSGTFVNVDETAERRILMQTVASQINGGSKLTIAEAQRLYGFSREERKQFQNLLERKN